MHTLLALWGIGGSELLIIFFLILLLFGAKRLPELARSLGQAKKEFQKAAKEVTEEIDKPKDNTSDIVKNSPPDNDSQKKS